MFIQTTYTRSNTLGMSKFIAGVFLLFLMLGERVGWFSPLLTRLEKLIVPAKMQVAIGAHSLASNLYVVVGGSSTSQRELELQEQYTRALARISELEVIEKEYTDITRLQADRASNKEVVYAPVVSYTQPMIGAGSSVGITSGTPLFNAGVLLGFVTESTESQARVALLHQVTSNGLVVETEKGVQGLARGDGKKIKIQEVPVNASVKLGERVVTFGQEGVPKGLFVGTIGSEERSPTASTKTFVIDQPQSFFTTTIVELTY